MGIEIKVSPSDGIRLMHERYPDLEPKALAAKGGWPTSMVRAALQHKRRDKPKSRLAR